MRQPRTIDPKTASQRRYIYVFQSGKFLKVGMAKDWQARLTEARLMNPHGITLVMRRAVRRNVVCDIERRIHEMLSPWLHGREWFTAPLETVRAAVIEAVAEGVELDRKDRIVHGAIAHGVQLAPQFGLTERQAAAIASHESRKLFREASAKEASE